MAMSIFQVNLIYKTKQRNPDVQWIGLPMHKRENTTNLCDSNEIQIYDLLHIVMYGGINETI